MTSSIMTAAVIAAALGIAAVQAPVAAAGQPKQGGSMVVTYKDDISTLDPAIGYDWQNWSMIKSLFDGLMDYKPGTTELIPDLAESYSVSDDGLVYTFKLRTGVKFHNGRTMTAADVVYSLNRAVDPATQSPGQGFFAAIKGFDDMAGGSAKSLSGVAAPDAGTVVIELTRPDATFLQVMAINFAFVVPKEDVERYGPDFGRNPVGTGAYKMTEWLLGQRVVFERNKDYFRAGTPYHDRITFEVGQDPTVALLRLQRGEVDVLGDPIPSAQFLDVINDPANKDLIVKGDLLHTGYLTMNVNTPPFDKKAVRQAVNMAINKERILRIVNNRGVAANQPLPPAMPGYDTSYAGYPFDVAKAKAMVAAAGYPDGVKTELFVMNTDPNPRIAQAIQQDLAAIGIQADVKSLAQSVVIAAGGDGTAPMIWSGGMAWIADYPDPSNFYGPILGCGGAVPGGWNWSKYCSKELEARAQAADAMADPAMADKRIELWRQIFVDIMEDAPWAPVFNEVRYAMHSKKLAGADIFYADPIHIPVHYEYVYNKDAQ